MNTTRENLEINRVALWGSIAVDGLSSRKYQANRTYVENGVMQVATPDRPIYRYVKRFTKHKKDFSVFLFSDEQDEKKIDKFMDSVVKKVTKSDVLEASMVASASSFKYTDMKYEEKES